jgi:hypothetical protein
MRSLFLGRSVQRCLALQRLEGRCLMAAEFLAPATAFVYELNRLRTDRSLLSQAPYNAAAPTQAGAITWSQPLAFNAQLTEAASEHARAMAVDDFFAHRNPKTQTYPNGRVRAAGYELPESLDDSDNDVELIAAGDDVQSPQAALLSLIQARALDDSSAGENRRSPLLGNVTPFNQHREIGVGFYSSGSANLENYWVVTTAHQNLGDRFITGVAFADFNGNLRYDIGEGLANVVITNGQRTTTTDATGAYRLIVAAGAHTLRISDPLTDNSAETLVVVNNDNVQVDFLFAADNIEQLVNTSVAIQTQVNYRQRTLWTNYFHHLDANQSGTLEPLDALVIINRLNRQGPGSLPLVPTDSGEPLVDTNGDGRLTPIDALLVINHLNRTSSSRAGEGEGETSSVVLSGPLASSELSKEKTERYCVGAEAP